MFVDESVFHAILIPALITSLVVRVGPHCSRLHRRRVWRCVEADREDR